MSTFTVFHMYSAMDTVTAANLNGNISSLVTAGNSIDRTNLLGGLGIDASSMNPSSGPAATFGGSQQYTFSNGLTLGAELDLTGTTVTAAKVAISGDAASPQGMLLNVPTGSTNGIQFQVNGATKVQVTGGGVLVTQGNALIGGLCQAAPTINATSTLGPVPPGYGSGGAALAATFHYCLGVTGSVGAGASTTITLSANAVYVSASTYSVTFSYVDANPINVVGNVQNLSGTQFTITNSDGVHAHTYSWVASGT